MPGMTASPATPLADLVITIAYPTGDDPALAEGLATFLRTRKTQKYLVRTVRATPGTGKEGQIEYRQ